jgi:hypothetical protein
MRTSWHSWSPRHIYVLSILASALILFATLQYTSIFYETLISGDMHEMPGFARIAIPDTFLYLELFKNFIQSDSIFVASNVKNSKGPISLWYLANGNWYVIAAINSFLVFLSMVYVFRIIQHFEIKLSKLSLTFVYIGITPIFVYYSIGALKEIPSLLGLLGFFYHYLKNQRVGWIFFALVLIFFRYQLIFPITAFVIIDKIFRNPLKISIVCLLIIASLYPFISMLNIFGNNATEIFRTDQAYSIGAVVEEVRNRIPFLSALAVLLRVFQSIFEPILTLIQNQTFYERDGFSIYLCYNFFQNLVLSPYWLLTIIGIIRAFFRRKQSNRDMDRIYAFLAWYMITVGGFSFISHRYLFPISGLILIGGLFEIHRKRSVRLQLTVGVKPN